MVYRRSSTNIRRAPRRRRQPIRRKTMRKRVTRRRATKPCVCPGDLTPTAKFALAQLDPFDARCQGAKVPDSNTIPSIANVDQDQVTLGTGATVGNLHGIAFFPSYTSATLVAGPGAALNWSINSFSARRNQPSVNTNVEGIRPVAHAIRVSSSLAPTSTTGFIHIGLAVESSSNVPIVGVPDLPTTINEMTGLPHYKRFTIASLTQSPITAINKWIDETAFRYDTVTSTPSFATTGGVQTALNFLQSWATIVVIVEGAPVSSNVLGFEHLLMSECIPKRTAFVLGTQAAPNSPGTMSAVSTMQTGTEFSHTEAEQESYISQGLQELDRGARVAGAQIWSNVAAPLLQRFGAGVVNTGTRMAVNAIMGRGGLVGVNSNPNRGYASNLISN